MNKRRRTLKELNKRIQFRKFENKSIQWNSIINNLIIPTPLRVKSKIYQEHSDFQLGTKLRNDCKITQRKRGIITQWGVSRFIFRKLAEEGYLPGVRKASW